MWVSVLVLLLKACLLSCQSYEQLPPSPCPSVFSYEGRTAERDRWYGVVLVSTDSPLTGLRLDIRLSRPAHILGNWEGEVTTNDNRRFTILNLERKIIPGPPHSVRIFVRFAEDQELPYVDMIALNGKQICPQQDNIYHRPPFEDRPWRPSGQETNLEPVEPLVIDSDYQAALRPTEVPPSRRTTTERNSYYGGSETGGQRPSGGYDSDSVRPSPPRRPADGYDGESAYERPATKRPNNGGRPSNGYDGDSDYERPAPNRPGNGYDSESAYERPTNNRPSNGYDSGSAYERPANNRPNSGYDTDTGYERPTTKRPSNGYDGSGGFERPTNNRPNNGYDTDSGYERPTTKRPNNGYGVDGDSGRPSSGYDGDNDYLRPSTKRPNNGYNNDFDRTTTTRRPSGEYDNGFYNNNNERPLSNNGGSSFQNPSRPNNNDFQKQTTTTRRPNNNNQPTTKRPTGNYDGGTKKPSNNNGYQTTRKPAHTTSTRRPDKRPGEPTTRRPTTLNAGERPPDGQVIRGQGTTRRPGLDVSEGPAGCGRIHISATPLVTYGQTTSRGQWPWHAALYKAKGINLTYTCGGTLVSATAVVTAAHCVTKMIGNWPVDADTLVVYLGKYHLKLWSEGGVQNRQVAEVHVHPQYNSSDFRSDVAVLVLSSPVDFTQYVRPACLWNDRSTDLRDIEGQDGYVVGWGYDEENRVTEELMMARMPIVSQQTCLYSYPEFFSIFTNNRTYCAGFNNGTSVCNGDSGGGMVLPEERSDGSKVWKLRGLVSISVSKEDKRVCDTKHYVVFTDLAKYRDWIEQYV